VEPGRGTGQSSREDPPRTRNPFTASAKGGQILSALQLPFFLLRPPRGYAVLTTVGRKTGKRRRRCIRAIVVEERAYLVAIKGLATTGWAQNALAHSVELRVPGRHYRGTVRELNEGDAVAARQAYCGEVHPFDYLTWMNWRKGLPTPGRIRSLLAHWLDTGAPLVIELTERRRITP
jgi:hypothetical protein